MRKVPDVDAAPFNEDVGISDNGTILYKDGVNVGHLIHELGHVLFGMEICEVDFLAWEWQVGKWLIRQGLYTEDDWHNSMSTYTVDYIHQHEDHKKQYNDFDDMPPDVRQKYLEELLSKLSDEIRLRLPE